MSEAGVQDLVYFRGVKILSFSISPPDVPAPTLAVLHLLAVLHPKATKIQKTRGSSQHPHQSHLLVEHFPAFQ